MPAVTVNGMEIAYADRGDPTGRPVLFLPGLGGDGRWWRPVTDRFARPFRCLLVDPRDAGRSGRASKPYTVADMAIDIACLADALGLELFDVVGFSMGGAIAQELAITRPERVRRLVLIATYTSGDPRGSELFRGLAALRRRLPAAEYCRILFPWVYTHGEYRRPGFIEEAIARAAADPLWQEPEAYERQVEAAIAYCSEGRLGAVRAPALLIFGDEDLMTPLRFARRLLAELPDARLAVLAGAGHGLLATRPTEVAALIEGFLAEA
ncbi:Putative non-heme bromoperoxidase BpoC [bacterium HR29]|jgi:3-oxoadipate enol-lactonase|nr:Putative non-heme bromoperoxidase BpoC [bacterium HR29]